MDLTGEQQAGGLFDPSKIDLVGLTKSADTVELFVVQDMPWTGSDAQLQSLRDKVDAYVSYATDGQMTAAYPETQGLPWRIVLHAQTGTPGERTAEVIAAITRSVPQRGGEFEARVDGAQ
jgi:hypothetical protein